MPVPTSNHKRDDSRRPATRASHRGTSFPGLRTGSGDCPIGGLATPSSSRELSIATARSSQAVTTYVDRVAACQCVEGRQEETRPEGTLQPEARGASGAEGCGYRFPARQTLAINQRSVPQRLTEIDLVRSLIVAGARCSTGLLRSDAESHGDLMLAHVNFRRHDLPRDPVVAAQSRDEGSELRGRSLKALVRTETPDSSIATRARLCRCTRLGLRGPT